MRRVVAVSMLLALAITIAILAAIPSTDDFDPSNPLWNGLSSFALERHATIINLARGPAPMGIKELLVIGPSTPFTPLEIERIKSFLARGGTLLIMDDFGTGTQLLKALGIRVDTYRGVLMDPLYYYRSYAFPRVKILNSTAVFNYGTAIRDWSEGRCIGWSSSFSFVDTNLDGKPEPGEPRGPLCVAIEIRYGRGLVIFVSDADLAINAMLNLNRVALDRLVYGGGVALVAGHWIHKPYTLARMALASAVTEVVSTSLRYPVAALAVALAWLAIPKWLKAKREPELCSDREIDRVITSILARHPTWNREELRELLREKLCRGR